MHRSLSAQLGVWAGKSRSFITQKVPKFAERQWNERLKGEMGRTLFTALFFALMVVLMMSAQIYSDRSYGIYVRAYESAVRSQNGTMPPVGIPNYAQVPLHDRGFLVFPDWTAFRSWLPDLLLTTLLGSTILFNIVWIHKPRMEYQGFVVARRFMWMLATLYFFRIWSFLATTVPSPLPGCTARYLPSDDLPKNVLVPGYLRIIGQMATGSISACTDNIYSAHTSLITLLVLTFAMYSGVFWLKVYALIHGAVAIWAILITRLHYTVDIYIALLVASFIFMNYHFILLIFLQGRLERYKTVMASNLNRLPSMNREDADKTAGTAGPLRDPMYTGDELSDQGTGVSAPLQSENDSQSQTSFNRQILERQAALDLSWLRDERRVVWRVIWRPLGRLLWWMDGMDLRRPVLDARELMSTEQGCLGVCVEEDK